MGENKKENEKETIMNDKRKVYVVQLMLHEVTQKEVGGISKKNRERERETRGLGRKIGSNVKEIQISLD